MQLLYLLSKQWKDEWNSLNELFNNCFAISYGESCTALSISFSISWILLMKFFNDMNVYPSYCSIRGCDKAHVLKRKK